MTRQNKVLGIVFSNMHDSVLGELTEHRTTGSVPYGGRYRLIDFVLSGMVNSDITDIGIITKQWHSLPRWEPARRHSLQQSAKLSE